MQKILYKCKYYHSFFFVIIVWVRAITYIRSDQSPWIGVQSWLQSSKPTSFNFKLNNLTLNSVNLFEPQISYSWISTCSSFLQLGKLFTRYGVSGQQPSNNVCGKLITIIGKNVRVLFPCDLNPHRIVKLCILWRCGQNKKWIGKKL